MLALKGLLNMLATQQYRSQLLQLFQKHLIFTLVRGGPHIHKRVPILIDYGDPGPHIYILMGTRGPQSHRTPGPTFSPAEAEDVPHGHLPSPNVAPLSG